MRGASWRSRRRRAARAAPERSVTDDIGDDPLTTPERSANENRAFDQVHGGASCEKRGRTPAVLHREVASQPRPYRALGGCGAPFRDPPRGQMASSVLLSKKWTRSGWSVSRILSECFA